ncbi:hypothetical protein STEG23_023186, partial [Scotinomys teguina]
GDESPAEWASADVLFHSRKALPAAQLRFCQGGNSLAEDAVGAFSCWYSQSSFLNDSLLACCCGKGNAIANHNIQAYTLLPPTSQVECSVCEFYVKIHYKKLSSPRKYLKLVNMDRGWQDFDNSQMVDIFGFVDQTIALTLIQLYPVSEKAAISNNQIVPLESSMCPLLRILVLSDFRVGDAAAQLDGLNLMGLIGLQSSGDQVTAVNHQKQNDNNYHNGQHSQTNAYSCLTHNGQHRSMKCLKITYPSDMCF